jgi:phosphatidylethanolamine/phosphatidyl-N-methylethanolamine N-methyltransferase
VRAASDPVSKPWLFFRRWMENPLQMGSLIPSSPALCRRVVRHVQRAEDEAIIELGAGTGVISRALLESGVPPEQLFVVEIAPAMAAHLRRVLVGVSVIEGDAVRLSELIPPRWHGRIGTVICGIPMVLLPLAEQRRIVAAIESVAPGRGFLHFSYCITSPLPSPKLRLAASREAWTPLNFPPASVWRYRPAT